MQAVERKRAARGGRSWRGLVPFGVAAVGVLIAAFLVLRPSGSAGLVGQQAPDFTITDVGGKPVGLAELHGHPVLLNFWGVECIYCRTEMPLLQRAQDQHRDAGLVVLGVDAQSDPAQDIRTFVAERRISYRMALGGSYDWSARYKVDPLPESVFIDRLGVIREDDQKPFLDAASLERALSSIL